MRVLGGQLTLRRFLMAAGLIGAVAVTGAIWAVAELWPSGDSSRDAYKERDTAIRARPHRVWSAVWAFRPETVQELVAHTQVVVEGDVTEVRAGEDLVSGSPSEPGGEQRIPTQRIDFNRLRLLAGSVQSPFTLFKTGSLTAELEDDPPYAVGERYVLFLTSQAAGEGTYVPVAPDGRLREDADGRVHPEIDGPVGDALDGKTVDEVARIVASAKSKQPRYKARRDPEQVASEPQGGGGGTP